MFLQKKCFPPFSRNCIEIISDVKFNNNKHWQSPIKGCFENTKSMQHLVWLQNAKCQCKLCGLCNCAVMARWIWPGLKNFGTGCSSKKLDILSNEKLRYFRFTLNPFDPLYIIREDLPEKKQPNSPKLPKFLLPSPPLSCTQFGQVFFI